MEGTLRTVAWTAFCGVAGTALMAGGAQAQSAPAGAAPPQLGVEEIVVTATRREANLQSVPVSVTAVSAKTLDNARVSSTEQLPQLAPNLVAVQNSTQMQFNLRGVASRGVYSGDENNVVIYLDGIYQPVPYTGLFDILEVERIEVLRGPQGTLFGRNANGGLVNIITPDPAFQTAGHFRASYGSFNALQLQGYATTPLGEKAAIDLAGSYYNDTGYVKDLISGRHVGDKRTYMARSKLLLKPTDDWKITLSGYYNHINDQSALANQPVNGRAAAAAPGVVIPTETNTVAFGTLQPFMRNRLFDVALKSEARLGGIKLEASASFSKARSHNYSDFDMTVRQIQEIESTQKDRIGLGEIRLLSDNDSPFQWTTGVFGFLTNNKYAPFTLNPFNIGVSPVYYIHTSTNKTKSFAPFAEGTYEITEQLKVTVGGRYSYEHRDFTVFQTSPLASLAGGGSAEKTWKRFTPKVSVQYIISPHANVYATWSRGFKSGLFDTSSVSLRPIDEERLNAYEIGLKTDPSRFLRFNLAGFYYRYRDLQVTGLDPASGTSRLLNAGRAHMWGIESEVTATPATGLTFRWSSGYLHTNFDSFTNAIISVPSAANPNANSSIIGNDTGRPLLRSPKFTTTLAADFATDVSFGRIGGGANVYYSAKYYFDPSYRLFQPSYVMANASLWMEPADRLRISLWIQNIADENIKRTALPTGQGDYATYQRPRSVGVTVDKRF